MNKKLASSIRFSATPLRWIAVHMNRRTLPRSASVYLLKILLARPALLNGLASFSPMDMPKIRLAASDSQVIRKVYWLGVQGYEGVLGKIWMRLCEQSESVLEVGGNIGLYATIGGKACKGCYTVLEPIPEIAAQIRQNLLLNNLTHVDCREAAAVPQASAQRVLMTIPNEGVAYPLGAQLAVGSEVQDRRADRALEVDGLPFGALASGCDLIKIDAEGIEAALLEAALPALMDAYPTLVVEVLPSAHRLAKLISDMATGSNYKIFVIPAYRSDIPVEIPAADFSSETPARYSSMDVILSTKDIAALALD